MVSTLTDTAGKGSRSYGAASFSRQSKTIRCGGWLSITLVRFGERMYLPLFDEHLSTFVMC